MGFFIGVLMAVILNISLIEVHAQFYTPSYTNTRCLNPNQRPGTCVSIYDCQTLLSVLQRKPLQPFDKEFVKASECVGGYGSGPYVCCTSDTGFTRSIGAENYWQSDNQNTILYPVTAYGGISYDTRQQRSSAYPFNTVLTSVPTPTISTNLLPRPPTCGGVTIANKIYGGVDADLNEFPWIVLLEYVRRSGGVTINCAGSLINKRYVVTAAHCVTGAIERQIGQLSTIRLGEHDITKAFDCNQYSCSPEAFRVGIDEIIPHELYKDTSSNKEFDIALVRLDRDVRFSNAVRPICLPSMVASDQQQLQPENTYFTVSGWGRTLKLPKSPVKQKLNIQLADQEQCRRQYRQRKVQIVDSQICAGGVYAEDSCDGDSGGPLMHFRNGAWVLEGIISFGYKCGLKGWPAVHTRVASYDAWIQSRIRN